MRVHSGIVICLFLTACSSGGGGDADAPGSLAGSITVEGTALSELQARSLVAQPEQNKSKASGLKRSQLLVDQAAQRRLQATSLWSVQIVWAADVDGQQWAVAEGMQLVSQRSAWHHYRWQGAAADLRRRLLSAGLAQQVIIAPLANTRLLPSDPFYATRQWNLQLIGMERAWDLSIGSSSVRVAVLDAGIDTTHAEFAGRLVDGYDFVSESINAGDGDLRDNDPSDPVPIVFGAISHGTHVSGILAANADGAGVVGIDHACAIMPVRCIGRLGGDLVDIWDAIIYAGDLTDADLIGFDWYPEIFPAGLDPDRPRPTAPADVINFSFGGDYIREFMGTGLQVYEDLLATCRAKGIVMVAAAGNEDQGLESTALIKLPAASPSVITVSAVGPEARLADYNNYGTAIDLAAPGGILASGTAVIPDIPESGGIYSANKGGDYGYLQGSSMAAPHVAGVCALMKALVPDISPELVEFYLENTALDIGDAGVDEVSGAGLMLADQALLAASGGVVPTQLVLYADDINIGWSESGGSVAYADLGGDREALGALTWTASYDGLGSDWISSVTFTDGLADIAITRDALADGYYRAVLTVESANGGSDQLRVDLEVLSSNPAAGIREVFVLLVDAEQMVVIAQAVVTVPGSSYRFEDLDPGLYMIAAGTDLDGDDYIDDAGEYFGYYVDNNGQGTVQLSSGGTIEGLLIDLTRLGLNGS